jgi:hypothetical protein
LLDLTTPHPAGPPPVRDGFTNRVIDPDYRHSNRRFASLPTMASQHQSLALVAEI